MPQIAGSALQWLLLTWLAATGNVGTLSLWAVIKVRARPQRHCCRRRREAALHRTAPRASCDACMAQTPPASCALLQVMSLARVLGGVYRLGVSNKSAYRLRPPPPPEAEPLRPSPLAA